MDFLSNNSASLQDNLVSLSNVINSFKNNTSRKQIMVLNLFVDDASQELKNVYLLAAYKHNLSLIEDPHFCNSGFDLFLPEEQTFTSGSVNKASFKVKCSAKICNFDNDNISSYFTGYYMYPRSSLSKTLLRLANSVGIIDAGYRGPLIGMFDSIWNIDYKVDKLTRLLQVCAPDLMPIFVRVVSTVDELSPETSRGEGGFGSTG
jgi:dUTP pyrophosphatase